MPTTLAPLMRMIPLPIRCSSMNPFRVRLVGVIAASLLLGSASGAAALAQDLAPLPNLAWNAVRDRSSEDLVRATWVLPSETVYPGQEVVLGVRIVIDARFLDESMVQPFTRRLDLPIGVDDLRVAGLEQTAFGLPETDTSALKVASGEHIVRAEPIGEFEADGRRWRGALLESRASSPRAGAFQLKAPTVRFASAEAFRDSLLGRVPIDPRLALSIGEPAVFEVADFPEAGRTPDFNGAIGAFHVRSSVNTRALEVGETLRLRVEIDGPLPQDADVLPRLDEWRGLHLVAQRVTHRGDGASIDAELRVERGTVKAIPAVALHSFDPRTASYLVASSAPIPLHVTATPDAPPETPNETGSQRWLIWTLLAAAVGGAIVVTHRSRSRGDSHAARKSA